MNESVSEIKCTREDDLIRGSLKLRFEWVDPDTDYVQVSDELIAAQPDIFKVLPWDLRVVRHDKRGEFTVLRRLDMDAPHVQEKTASRHDVESGQWPTSS